MTLPLKQALGELLYVYNYFMCIPVIIMYKHYYVYNFTVCVYR